MWTRDETSRWTRDKQLCCQEQIMPARERHTCTV
jgi:hypothetical protein